MKDAWQQIETAPRAWGRMLLLFGAQYTHNKNGVSSGMSGGDNQIYIGCYSPSHGRWVNPYMMPKLNSEVNDWVEIEPRYWQELMPGPGVDQTFEEETFAQSAFAFEHLRSAFEEKLDSFTGKNEGFEYIGWDEYDKSLELYQCTPKFRLSLEASAFIWQQGFTVCYLNHSDGWNTFYYPHTDHRRPWRRRARDGGGFYVNYIPETWRQLIPTDFVTVVLDEPPG